MSSATIFIKNNLVDVRFEGQALPAGARVVGFVTPENSIIETNVDVSEAVRYINDVFSGRWEGDENYDLPL